MSKCIPISVQQIAESMLNKSTPAHVKFNNSQVLRDISEYCDAALRKFDKKA